MKFVQHSIFQYFSTHCQIVFFTSFLAVFFVVSTSQVLAQGSNSLTIIPPKFELFANPGDTVTEKIRVRNEASTPMTYTILIEDFTTSGEEGQVVLEEGEQTSSFSLAKWIDTSSKDLILQPNEEKSFSFMINVPRSAEPGGHYASILFQSGGDVTVEGGAKVAQRVGSLILLRVSGNVIEKASLENFSAPQYLERGPVTFLTRVKNDSNTHIIPQGTIVITDLFGKKVTEIPLEGRNVLPGATRKMETTWTKASTLGSFTATLIATYGQNKLPLTAVVKFTIIPKIALILGISSMIILVGILLSLIFGRKRLAKVLQILTKG